MVEIGTFGDSANLCTKSTSSDLLLIDLHRHDYSLLLLEYLVLQNFHRLHLHNVEHASQHNVGRRESPRDRGDVG